MSDDWTDTGNDISTPGELLEFISLVRAEVHHMRVGLARAAWGSFRGRPWSDRSDGQQVPNAEDIVGELDMSATPPGMTAKDASLRQSLASLLAVLDAADHAALGAWMAHTAAADPERTA